MAGSTHRPYAELDTVRCRDCWWAQAVNEDRHRENTAGLLDWHAAHPEQGFDHLSDRDFGITLRVPDHVRWSDDGSGRRYRQLSGRLVAPTRVVGHLAADIPQYLDAAHSYYAWR